MKLKCVRRKKSHNTLLNTTYSAEISKYLFLLFTHRLVIGIFQSGIVAYAVSSILPKDSPCRNNIIRFGNRYLAFWPCFGFCCCELIVPLIILDESSLSHSLSPFSLVVDENNRVRVFDIVGNMWWQPDIGRQFRILTAIVVLIPIAFMLVCKNLILVVQ